MHNDSSESRSFPADVGIRDPLHLIQIFSQIYLSQTIRLCQKSLMNFDLMKRLEKVLSFFFQNQNHQFVYQHFKSLPSFEQLRHYT